MHSSWPRRRRAHGSVTRTLDLRDLTRSRSDRESEQGQPVPVCAGVMSRPLLLTPAPASEIDQASHSSPSSHPLLIPDLPNPLSTRPTPPIQYPLFEREPHRQPFKPFFDIASHQTLHHHRRNPPNPYPVATPASPTTVSDTERPQHQTPATTTTTTPTSTATVPAGSHGSPTPLVYNPSRHPLFSLLKCRTITNRAKLYHPPNHGRHHTSALVVHLHTDPSLYDVRLPSLHRRLPCRT